MLIGVRCSVAKKQRAKSEYPPAMERSNNEKSHIQADVLLMAHRVNSVKPTSTHSHDYMQFKYKCVHFHNRAASTLLLSRIIEMIHLLNIRQSNKIRAFSVHVHFLANIMTSALFWIFSIFSCINNMHKYPNICPINRNKTKREFISFDVQFGASSLLSLKF